MTDKKDKILLKFKEQMVVFMDELITLLPDETDIILIRIFLDINMTPELLMNEFTKYINNNNKEFKKMIEDRNEKFFIEHNLFDAFEKDKVNHFKNLWLNSTFSQENKNIIWKWLDTFVSLSELYNL
jgi:hypothetical protein